MSKLETFWDYINACVDGDRLMFVCITSSAEGKIPSEGFMFGEGKSSLAAGLSKIVHKKKHSLGDLQSEELVKENMGYTWEHHIKAVREAKEQRKLVYILDDLQRIAGKSKSRDRKVQEWAEFFSTARPLFAVIIATCPSLGDLAKCWRDLMMFEIKVPVRGTYEVQRIKTKTIYRKPLDPIKLLHYFGEAQFPKPSPSWEHWYVNWRKEGSYNVFEDMITRHGYKGEEEEQTEPPTLTEVQQAGQILVRHREALRNGTTRPVIVNR